MNKFIVIAAVAAISFSSIFVLSASSAQAEETKGVQKAYENAKQYLDDLVTAKDENQADNVGLRVETFRQVLDLAKAEAKDFEFKLITVDKDETFEAWKKEVMDSLTKDMVFIDSQKELLSDIKSIDLAKVKKIAKNFKAWRDGEYMPLASQIQDFLLVKQEAKAVQTAQARLQKITTDIKNIKQPKITDSKDIKNFLDKSKTLINQAAELNKKALNIFTERYANSKDASSTDIIATSTIAMTTSTVSVPILNLATSSVLNSSSSLPAQAGPADVSAFPPIVSIKDLVRSSLDKIKESYQGFIDISNLVRKLLK
ncbi:MAG: hypothetical protein AAB377_01800 [Patescibacteria group bacterium]